MVKNFTAPHNTQASNTQASNTQASIVAAAKLVPLLHELYYARQVLTYWGGVNISFFTAAQISSLFSSLFSSLCWEDDTPNSKCDLNLAYLILEQVLSRQVFSFRLDLIALIHQAVAKESELASLVAECVKSASKLQRSPRDIVLYGFGRIGRLLARMLTTSAYAPHARLRAIVVRDTSALSLERRARLLTDDSVHGKFTGCVAVDLAASQFIINGQAVDIIQASEPASVDYTSYAIKDAVVVDNSGIYSDKDGLSLHLAAAGISQVLLTAPARGEIKNIVYGVNSDAITPADKLLAAASCTTNAIVPCLKLIDDAYGIQDGHLETVHSYTNDQNLLDNYHKKDRRGRSAAINMVLTSTGAASAVTKILPNLAGRLTGNAVRVPTPNVSLAILNLTLHNSGSKKEVNQYLSVASKKSSWYDIFAVSDSPDAVSTDFIGAQHPGVVDLHATIVNNNNVVLYIWYDNEYSYSCQVMRLIQQICGDLL